jgi:HD-like signal output (HDOD) protein
MLAPVPPNGALSPATLQAAARALGAGGSGASRLLAVLYDPEVELDEVLAALTSEPALTARVLKVANSGYYRQSGSVGTVERAVQVLGLKAIRGIAAAGCLDRLAPARSSSALDPELFRRHSLAVGCAAQGLSQAARLGVDAEAFMTGLLHDIGLLLLLKAAPEALACFKPLEGASAAESQAHEQAHLGGTHEACGTLLVQAWKLPAWLLDALGNHHAGLQAHPAPSGPGLQALPALVNVAEHVAQRAGLGLWPACGLPPDASSLQALGLEEAQLATLAAALPNAVAMLSP